MNTPLLLVSGFIGLVTALVHGYLGQTKLLAKVNLESELGQRALYAVFHLSTFYWAVAGIVLLLAPWVLEPVSAPVVIWTIAFVYLTGAVGNFWLARGRHIGWVLLTASALLAVVAI